MSRIAMNLNLEYYKVFYHVGRLGSITLAAEKLCISQPAVSQAVRQLEVGLGTRLFLRTSKGVLLTREGELLYRHVKQGLEDIWRGEELIKRIQDMEAGEVRIGASDMTLQFYLLPYLERFHELHPKVKVAVSNGPTPETMGFLLQGTVDFGVVTTPLDIRPQVKAQKVKEIGNAFVAGEKFSYLKGQDLDYQVLSQLPCIFLEKNTSTRRFMDEFLAGKNMVIEPEFQLATSDMVVQFAMRNLGIGCVMSEFASKELEAGRLFQLQFKEPMPKRHICIVTDAKNPMSPAGEKMLEILLDGLEQSFDH